MKVFVTIPCLMLGGSEIAALQMVQALVSAGYDITVVCYYEYDAGMVSRYQKAGANVSLLEEKRDGLRGMWKLLCRLVEEFHKNKPDIVHVQYFAPGMIPILAARLSGVYRIFATVHAAGNNGYSWKNKLLFRISAAMTHHFFCVAENTEQFWFGKINTKKHSTIHNGVDIDFYKNATPIEISGIKPEDLVIGIAGRVVKLKGHDCLFRAVKRLMPKYPNLKVLVVGDGIDRQYFEELAGELNITDHIVWAGRVEPEKLPGHYKLMDVLAMPSHWEGFGLTAAEAMAAGVPVVASDVPGLQEVVGNSGVLFHVNDDIALAKGICRVLEERDTFSEKTFQRVKESFSLLKQQKIWKDMYTNFL